MRYALECLLDDVCHLQEAAAFLTEGEVDYFIGCIDNASGISTYANGFVCHLEATELFWVGFLKG